MKRLFTVLTLTAAVMADKIIVVDLSKQMAYAKEGNTTRYKGRISSGKPGYETPNGTYTISQKEIKHRSTLYPKPNGGGYMDYMMRLNQSAYALHLGDTPGYPASHGCVRLESIFSQKVYHWAEIGTKVLIKGNSNRFKGRSAKESAYGVIMDKELYPGNISLNRMNARNSEIY